MEYHIKNEEWEVILKKLQNIKRIDVKDQEHTRKFIEALWYIVRSGCQWRLLPSVYGHWRGGCICVLKVGATRGFGSGYSTSR